MQYIAHLNWKRNNLPFTAKAYDRTHTITFGGGSSVSASSAPEFLGKAELANPEELFTASLSSCFMLTFLYLATTKGLVINEYNCEAVGTLGKNAEGKMAMTDVVLKPFITFEGTQPDSTTLNELFKKAHDTCFISCSVKTNVKVEAKESVAS